MSMSHQYESQLSSFGDFLSSSALGCNIPFVNSNNNYNSISSSSSNNKKRRNHNSATNTPTTLGKRRRRYHYLNKREQNDTNEDGDDTNKMTMDHPAKGSLVLIDEIPNLHTVENHQRFRYV